MTLWIMTVLIALMTVAAYPREAVAEMDTGNDILEWCEYKQKDTLGWYKQGLCDGYLNGIVEGLLFAQHAPTGIQITFNCKPEAVTRGQTELVIVKYLKAHPEQLHNPAVMLVYSALAEAFPCD